MKWILCVEAVFLVLVLYAASSAGEKKIVCYLGSWSTYRPGNGQFEVENIDPFLCTHVIFAFVGLSYDGSVRILDSWNEIDKGAFRRFNELRLQNPALKTLVAIGGWNEGSTSYSYVMNDDTLRQTFVNSVVAFVQEYGFDGFDLDWEYPCQRGGAATDKEAFTKLLQELRVEFDKHGYLLSAAVAAAESSASLSYDIAALGTYLDFINIMSYDLHGSWDSNTGHNSPLYVGPADLTDNEKKLNVDACVKYWLSQGAPAEKLIVGMGTYGRTFTMSSTTCAIGVPATGAGSAGPYTRESGMLGYNEICEQQSSWTEYWDEDQQVPYACNGNQFVGYDNVKSITKKAEYIVQNGLGGGMIWSLETDDFLGICLGYKYPLLTAINTAFGNDITTPATTTTTTTTRNPLEPTEEEETLPATDPPTVTDSPVGDKCTKEGFMRDSADCSVFYNCVSDGNGGYIQYSFQCQSGLLFDTSVNTCNWPSSVTC